MDAIAERPLSLKIMLLTLGDGSFHDNLQKLKKSKRVSADLLCEEVESVARDMQEVIDKLGNWDEDCAYEVHTAALAYLEACEQFCRDRLEAGY